MSLGLSKRHNQSVVSTPSRCAPLHETPHRSAKIMNIGNKNIADVIAGVLAISSCVWAILITPLCAIGLVKGFYEPVIWLSVLFFIPGWVVFAGWWLRFRLHALVMNRRKAFWAVSALVNGLYFLALLYPFGPAHGAYPINFLHYWWAFAVILSVVALLTDGQNQAGVSTPSRCAPLRETP